MTDETLKEKYANLKNEYDQIQNLEYTSDETRERKAYLVQCINLCVSKLNKNIKEKQAQDIKNKNTSKLIKDNGSSDDSDGDSDSDTNQGNSGNSKSVDKSEGNKSHVIFNQKLKENKSE